MDSFLFALMLLFLSSIALGDSCIWETETQGARYTFNLAGPMTGYVHGIRSEDGFYKLVKNPPDGDKLTVWFQLCEHMKFNHDPPICQSCQTCGGPDHCGETCSALQAVSYLGFSLCKTLGFASTSTYSLIDKQKPEQGLVVSMVANTSNGDCSLSVSIFCKANGEELPSSITGTGCHLTTAFKHPVGCPQVTQLNTAGLGWFSTFFIVLLCFFVLYMVGATLYRRKALGISGLEAVPHMEFWRTIPSNVQWGVEYAIGKVISLYRRVTEPSFVGVND